METTAGPRRCRGIGAGAFGIGAGAFVRMSVLPPISLALIHCDLPEYGICQWQQGLPDILHNNPHPKFFYLFYLSPFTPISFLRGKSFKSRDCSYQDMLALFPRASMHLTCRKWCWWSYWLLPSKASGQKEVSSTFHLEDCILYFPRCFHIFISLKHWTALWDRWIITSLLPTKKLKSRQLLIHSKEYRASSMYHTQF